MGVVLSLHDISARVRLEEQSKTLALLEERERIAMDLHDGVIQSLYAVVLNLGARAREENSAGSRRVLHQAATHINDVIREIREYIFDLKPKEFSERGLVVGLKALADELRASTRIWAELALSHDVEDRLGPVAKVNLLHVAREAVSNVIRHAGTDSVQIELVARDGQVHLVVHDNRCGFASEDSKTREGQGLGNMAERATAIGGKLALVSRPGWGTEVRVDVPLAEGKWEHDRVTREAIAGG